jgi:hypothetical protein
MSEAHHATSPALDVERAVKVALTVVLAGKHPHKVAIICRRWLGLAEALEADGLPRAKIYPIRGGGARFGERPIDREKLEAARVLRAFARENLRGAE